MSRRGTGRAALVAAALLCALMPAVALAEYVEATCTVSEPGSIVPAASETQFVMPTGNPLTLKSVTYSRSFGFPFFQYVNGDWLNVFTNGWLHRTYWDDTAANKEGANVGDDRDQFTDFDYSLGTIKGGKDGVAVICGLGWESSIDSNHQAYNQTCGGGVSPWVISGISLPTFGRGERGTLANLDSSYSNPWKGGYPETSSGDTTLPAVADATNWYELRDRAPQIDYVRGIMIHTSVPSTHTVGQYVHTTVFFFSDKGRTSKRTETWTSASPDYNRGFTAHANASEMNATPGFACTNGNYTFGSWTGPTDSPNRFSLTQSMIVVSAYSTNGAEVQRLHLALPKLAPFPQDSNTPMTGDPNAGVETLGFSDWSLKLQEWFAPVSAAASEAAGSLLWPLRMVEGIAQ